MRITAAARVNTGRVRANNEDNLSFNGITIAPENRDIPFSADFDSDTDYCAFAVCDGMGGECAGEEASIRGARHFSELFGSADRIVGFAERVSEYCAAASQDIYGFSQECGGRSGCTFVGAVFTDDSLDYANIGDSRMYAVCGDRLVQLSDDHTLANVLYRNGTITAEQAKVSPDRNRLTRYLGAPAGNATAAPSIGSTISLRVGDRFLLCSDGLTDMVSDDDILKILAAEPDDSKAADILLSAALDNGGRDNCTVVVITVRECSGSGKGGRGFSIPPKPAQKINRWHWAALLGAVLLLLCVASVFLTSAAGGDNAPAQDGSTLSVSSCDTSATNIG